MTTLPHTHSGRSTDGRPTLVLLHFFGSSRRQWRPVAGRLADRFATVAIDLPGFGDAADAGKLFGGYGVEAMARAVGDTIAASVDGAFALVGHSMSGKVAMVLAASGRFGEVKVTSDAKNASDANGDRIDGSRRIQDDRDREASDGPRLTRLALVSPSPPGPEPIPDAARSAMLGYARDAACAATYLDDNTYQPLAGDRRDRAIADFVRASPAAWRAWLTGGANEDCAAAVGTLALPTLLITGQNEPTLGLAAQRTHTLPHLAGARTIELPDCGHVSPLEQPNALAAALAAFAGA